MHNIRKIKKLLLVLQNVIIATFMVFCLNARIEIIEEVYPFETLLGKLAMQMTVAYYDASVGDILEFLAIMYLIYFCKNNSIPRKSIAMVLSFILSCIYFVSMSYLKYDSFELFSGVFQKIYVLELIVGYSLILYLLVSILYWALDCTSLNINENFSSVWKKAFFTICIAWSPWLFINYPGSFNPDSIGQLLQFFGYSKLSAVSPPLSTIIMGSCVSIGSVITPNFGVFLYIFLHYLLGSIIFSYSIAKIYELGVNSKICMGGVGFFALLPMWGCYVQWFEKSLLYTELCTLFTVFLMDVIKKRSCSINDILKLTFSGIATSMLRNNGIYCVVPAVIVLFFYLKKTNRVRIIITGFLIISIMFLFNRIIYPAMGFSGISANGYLTICLQQTGRYVLTYGDEITDSEKQAISGILNYEKIAENYDPILADGMYSCYTDRRDNIPAYMKTWFKMFFKHPNIYFSALINNCYGYIAPVNANVGTNFDYGDNDALIQLGIKRMLGELPLKLFDALHVGSEKWPLLKYFSMAGTYTWIIIMLIVYLVINRKYDGLILFCPIVITILVCIAGPCTSIFRYYQSNAASMPLLIGWVIYKRNC